MNIRYVLVVADDGEVYEFEDVEGIFRSFTTYERHPKTDRFTGSPPITQFEVSWQRR